MSNKLIFPYVQIPDPSRGGRVLFNASIYVGLPDTNPTTPANQVRVYYVDENGSEINLSQPLTTNTNGLIVNSESGGIIIDARVDTDENGYSILIQDRSNVQRYYDPNVPIEQSSTSAENVSVTGGGNVQNFIDTQRFSTVSEAISYSGIDSANGHRIYIEELNSYFYVDLTSNVTDNSLSVFQSNANPTYSIVEESEVYETITQTLTVTEDAEYVNKSNLRNSRINITGRKTLTTPAGDIARNADTLTLDNANFSVGDCIVIEGTIEHENYTPTRFTSLSLVAVVRSVTGNSIKIDRNIDFIATGVNVSKIPKITFEFEGDLDSSTIALTNVFSASIKGRCFGSVGIGGGQSFVSISSASAIDLDLELDNAEAALCIVNQNISSGIVNIKSNYSGGDSVIGGVGNSSKVYRANAIQNMIINGVFLSSRNVDATIYGARNIVANIVSYGGGANFFDANDSGSNRLESVQFSEGDRITLNGHMVESNDQCAEFLGCSESIMNGFYANAVNTTSTEGAIVIKGECVNATVNAEVRGYGSRGVKFELAELGVGYKVSPNSTVISSNQEAISVRDAPSAHDTRCQLRGSFSGFGNTVIDIRENSNGVTVDATVNMGNATAGVFVAASDWNISVHGINTQTNKQVLSIGNTATNFNVLSVSGETDDIFVQYNGDSRSEFTMSQLNGICGRAEFGGINQYFVMKGGEAYSNIVPTMGSFDAGDSYKRESYNTPAGDETLFGGSYRRVEEGRIYTGTDWRVKYALVEIGT